MNTGIVDIILCGDSREALRSLPADSVNCAVTSPPYYGLRDYGADGQIGREETPERYIENLVGIFREVHRVLRPDGTLWLNIADSYCGTGHKGEFADPKYPNGRTGQKTAVNNKFAGCKAKDLIGIPFMLALALRDDGWYLRNSIIWEKGNAMPESAKDRLTRSYEFVFLLAKSRKYYFDGAAIAEPMAAVSVKRLKGGRTDNTKYADKIPGQTAQNINRARASGTFTDEEIPKFRNKRDVWRINTCAYHGVHYAAFPPKLAETCILAGCPVGCVVLDPFMGSGTVGLAAKQSGRHYIGVELNAEYCRLADERIKGVSG